MDKHNFVICAYQESPYLEECIRSLTKQTIQSPIRMVTSTPCEYIKTMAEKYKIRLLGQLPLHISLREDLDRGEPTMACRPDSEFAHIYRQLAANVAAQLYWQGESIPTEIAFRAL